MLLELNLVYIMSYLVTGIFAGLIAGLLGLGGGIVIVPVLYYLFLQQGFPPALLMQMAVATSLATIVITSLVATYTHHRHAAVLWQPTLHLSVGILLGAGLGGLLVTAISSDVLRISFAIFELLVALQVGLQLSTRSQAALPDKFNLAGCGGVIGCISTLLGIGGGTLTVPLLLYCNVGIRHAVAVAAACGFPIALVATVALLIVARGDTAELPLYSWGYIYSPAAISIITMTCLFAPLGGRVAHIVPTLFLKRLFACVLALIGLKMLLSG